MFMKGGFIKDENDDLYTILWKEKYIYLQGCMNRKYSSSTAHLEKLHKPSSL